MKKQFLVLMLLSFFVGGCWKTSEGERVGTIVKFSKHGLIWKNWDGELVLGGLRHTASGTIANTWTFGIDKRRHRNESIALLIQKALQAQESGKRVKIIYIKEAITAPWRSDSSYLVQDIIFLE